MATLISRENPQILSIQSLEAHQWPAAVKLRSCISTTRKELAKEQNQVINQDLWDARLAQAAASYHEPPASHQRTTNRSSDPTATVSACSQRLFMLAKHTAPAHIVHPAVS